MNYLKQVLESFLGTYTPIVKTLSDGSEVVQYDIEYIAAALLLIICILCIFKLIGGLICNK